MAAVDVISSLMMSSFMALRGSHLAMGEKEGERQHELGFPTIRPSRRVLMSSCAAGHGCMQFVLLMKSRTPIHARGLSINQCAIADSSRRGFVTKLQGDFICA